MLKFEVCTKPSDYNKKKKIKIISELEQTSQLFETFGSKIAFIDF